MFKDVGITLLEAQVDRFGSLAEQWVSTCLSGDECDYTNMIDCVNLDFAQKPVPTADQVRDAIASLWLKPRCLPVKLLLIFNAQLMNQQVANALLKMLEEPPQYLRALLLTSHHEQVLMTIRSRSLVIFDDVGKKTGPLLGTYLAYLEGRLASDMLCENIQKAEGTHSVDDLLYLIGLTAQHTKSGALIDIWDAALSLSRLSRSRITWNKQHFSLLHLNILADLKRFVAAN